MDQIAADLLLERRELGLTLGVRAGHDQSRLLMEDAQVRLPVEVELAQRGRAQNSREADNPWSGFADARGHGHTMRIVRAVLRNRLERPFVEIERVLRQPSE